MKRVICSWIVLLPISSFAQLTGSEITFIKLTDGIGFVIDSIENEKCKCITYVNKKVFQYAALVQFPDSHVVLRIKSLNHFGFTDVQMTEEETASLHTSALNINHDISVVDTNTDKLMLIAILGDDTFYHFLNYEELKFPVNLTERNTSKDKRVYKQFKVGLGIGAGVTFSYNISGLLLTLEPATRINDEMAVGFRIESMTPIFSSGSISSYTMNFQYYFSVDKFRPLAAIGFGLYSGQNGVDQKFGYYPRLGFDIDHFNLSIDYNLFPYENIKVYSYLGFRIGFFVGGGRK